MQHMLALWLVGFVAARTHALLCVLWIEYRLGLAGTRSKGRPLNVPSQGGVNIILMEEYTLLLLRSNQGAQGEVQAAGD